MIWGSMARSKSNESEDPEQVTVNRQSDSEISLVEGESRETGSSRTEQSHGKPSGRGESVTPPPKRPVRFLEEPGPARPRLSSMQGGEEWQNYWDAWTLSLALAMGPTIGTGLLLLIPLSTGEVNSAEDVNPYLYGFLLHGPVMLLLCMSLCTMVSVFVYNPFAKPFNQLLIGLVSLVTTGVLDLLLWRMEGSRLIVTVVVTLGTMLALYLGAKHHVKKMRASVEQTNEYMTRDMSPASKTLRKANSLRMVVHMESTARSGFAEVSKVIVVMMLQVVAVQLAAYLYRVSELTAQERTWYSVAFVPAMFPLMEVLVGVCGRIDADHYGGSGFTMRSVAHWMSRVLQVVFYRSLFYSFDDANFATVLVVENLAVVLVYMTLMEEKVYEWRKALQAYARRRMPRFAEVLQALSPDVDRRSYVRMVSTRYYWFAMAQRTSIFGFLAHGAVVHYTWNRELYSVGRLPEGQFANLMTLAVIMLVCEWGAAALVWFWCTWRHDVDVVTEGARVLRSRRFRVLVILFGVFVTSSSWLALNDSQVV